MKRSLAACAMLFSCVASAPASDLVDISFQVDGWAIMPIAENSIVTHVIAARIDDQMLLTDIDVVLYEKTITGWDGYAYDSTVTKEDAIADLAIEFGLPDPFSGAWHINLDADNLHGQISPRIPFDKGFFIGDPLYDVAIQMDDPEPLAELAEYAGIEAGSSAVNTGSLSGGVGIGDPSPTDCGCDACIQNAVAMAAEAFLANPVLTTAEIHAIFESAYLPAPGGCCPETTTCGPIVSAGWNCTGWIFNDYNPRTGNCEYKRNIFRLQSISCVKKCSDCLTVINFTQNRIQSGDVFGVTGPSQPASACVPPPNNPCRAIGITNVTTTNWAPPPPACP